MCQDGRAGALPFVDEAFDLGASADSVRPASGPSCRVVRPDIGGLLPVYVYDDYEGFRVKRFVDLTDVELEHYTALNVDAMTRVIESFAPEAIITGHEVMGPYIAREACAPTGASYVAKLHGSALEYAVKLQERYRDYAELGLGGARRVAGGSAYMVREASSFIPGWIDRSTVVNPGCDVELFTPAPERRSDPPVVAFVGKLMAPKGVHHLLAALGLLDVPQLRVVIVGYGGFADGLQELATALQRGDMDMIRAVAERGEHGPLHDLLAFVDSGRMDAAYFNRIADIEITFTGRLEHDALSSVLPTFDVLAVPSVIPEAFGMVAAEGAACGVLPVVPDHSGIAEAGAAVEEAIGSPGLLTYASKDPISSLAEAIDRVLAIPRADRDRMGSAAAELARARWSWRNVADSLLQLTT